jgi:hypothetical protein
MHSGLRQRYLAVEFVLGYYDYNIGGRAQKSLKDCAICVGNAKWAGSRALSITIVGAKE